MQGCRRDMIPDTCSPILSDLATTHSDASRRPPAGRVRLALIGLAADTIFYTVLRQSRTRCRSEIC